MRHICFDFRVYAEDVPEDVNEIESLIGLMQDLRKDIEALVKNRQNAGTLPPNLKVSSGFGTTPLG